MHEETLGRRRDMDPHPAAVAPDFPCGDDLDLCVSFDEERRTAEEFDLRQAFAQCQAPGRDRVPVTP